MESAGMMNMATGDGSPPPGRVPEQGPDWFLVVTEACGGGTPDLGFFLEVWGYIRGVGIRNNAGGVHEAATRQGRAYPRGGLGTILVHLRRSVGFFWSKNNLRKFSGQLDSV